MTAATVILIIIGIGVGLSTIRFAVRLPAGVRSASTEIVAIRKTATETQHKVATNPQMSSRVTDTTWAFRWPYMGGTRELAYVFGKERWELRFRVKPGGWTKAQYVDLESPANDEQARRVAKEYASHHGLE